MSLFPAVSDEALADVVSTFSRSTAVVLRDPERWLGLGLDVESGPLPRRAAVKGARLVFGRSAPGAPGWEDLPVAERAEWWVTRISTLAGFLAATPRVAGAAADRLPIQAALGASVQGLAVCAVAREHGVRDPADWVPLIGKVVFDRTLPRGTKVSEAQAASIPKDLDDGRARDAGPFRRARRTTAMLARTFLAAQGMFDERPRGAWAFRAVGKVPVVGLFGGWLDERGGVRKAAAKAARMIEAPASQPKALR